METVQPWKVEKNSVEGSDEENILRHLDLFSGIGGFALAARWAGIKTIAFCEIDPFCQKVLKKHWPTVPIINDIREVTSERIAGIIADTESRETYPSESGRLDAESCGEDRDVVADTTDKRCQRGSEAKRWEESDRIGRNQMGNEPCRQNSREPRIDLLTGGFPCQPFSVAGSRKGKSDDRFLWPEMLRVIREIRPRWIIAENVPGLISIGDGLVFEGVCTDLESEGYEVQTLIIPACSVGAPHRRDRVWIVAHTLNGRPQERRSCDVGQMERGCGRGQEARNIGSKVTQSDSHATDPNGKGSQGRYELSERAGERPTGKSHSQYWDEHWYTVALRTCTRKLDDGLPRGLARHRVNKLKALGNSIVPAVAYQIMKAILETM